MNRIIVFITGIFLLWSALVVAQDPDDPGAPDSLIFGTVDVEYNPGQDTYIDVPIYFVTDDSIASVMIPVEWSSVDGNITAVSATWTEVFDGWEDTYNNDTFTWFVGFHDTGGEPGESPLFTDGLRVEGITLEFHISGDAAEQLVPIGIGEGPYGLPVNFGLITPDSDEDITPVVLPGYVRYGAVDVEDDSSKLPDSYALKQNYPNPFNPETNFDYHLPQDCFVEIEIFNILGQSVLSLISEKQAAGVHTIHWDGLNNDGQAAPSGIYFYWINAGDFSDSKKMVMIR